MSNLVSFNPMLTTNAAGSFSVQSEGYVQGTALDDPAIRYQLVNGVLALTESLPMWGGCALTENIPNPGFGNMVGGNVGRALNNAAISGFSVFNQGSAMINWPQNKVPITGQGGTVPFYRLGSNARIPVQCDPSLASLQGGAITQQVSWDFNNQILQPYDASTATITISSMTATFANGVYTIAVVTAAASVVGAVGDSINISGATNSGTGGAALVNGNFVVTAFTDSQHFSFQVTAVTGAIGTIAGTPVLNQGTGALPVKVLEINSGNSKVVTWSPTLLTANWNLSGSVALIQI
jgi:hypothetical protein